MITPLKTLVGIPIADFYKTQSDKTIIIWGTGYLGFCIQRAFRKFGAKNLNFCESVISKDMIRDVPVIDINRAIADVKSGFSIIICASAQHSKEMKDVLINENLKQNEQFFLHYYFRRTEAQIDISGKNSLMDFVSFRGIIDKLKKEDIFSLTLGGFYDPFEHNEVTSFIKEAENFFPVHVVTEASREVSFSLSNLPSLLSIKVTRFDERILQNILNLENFVSDSNLLNLNFELTSNNSNELKLYEKRLTGIKIKIVQSFKYPNYDFILSKQLWNYKGLAWNFSEALKAAKKSKLKTCLCQRIFPVIQSDLTTLQCHLYQDNVLHNNFLDVEFSNLIFKRDLASQCGPCQALGLQRLDIDVLCKDSEVQSKIFSGLIK